jgi:chorismate mutase
MKPGLTAEIQQVRAQVDSIDRQIAVILAHRFSLTNRIGQLKAEIGEEPLDPSRQKARQDLLRQLAMQTGVELSLLEEIFDAVKERTQRSHMQHLVVRQTDVGAQQVL